MGRGGGDDITTIFEQFFLLVIFFIGDKQFSKENAVTTGMFTNLLHSGGAFVGLNFFSTKFLPKLASKVSRRPRGAGNSRATA